MNQLENEALYELLRIAVDNNGSRRSLSHNLSSEAWKKLHIECIKNLLVGVVYRAISLLPREQQPPLEIAFQWASEAETIKGQNRLLNAEAARLTELFAAQGRKTAVLKGPANACLYPDPYMRQVGDIDLWVDGGRKSVLDLLKNMGYEIPEKDLVVPHHVHLHPVENGISVEIHFCPSSGVWNPFSGARLLRFLEKEIQNVERVSEGFCVPTMKFALVMQLAHIQRHFVSGGIGFKQIIDYYILLVHSTEDDLREISNRLSEFGLLHGCRALMWVLGNVFGLDKSKMLCKPNEKSGRKMLAVILEGGNFGFYAAERLKDSSMNVLLRWLKHRLFFVRKMWYSPFEVLCRELDYWFHFIKTIGLRIKTRRFSLWSMYHNKANSDRRKSLCEK